MGWFSKKKETPPSDLSATEISNLMDNARKALTDYVNLNGFIVDSYEGSWAYVEKNQNFYQKIGDSWFESRYGIPKKIVLELLKYHDGGHFKNTKV